MNRIITLIWTYGVFAFCNWEWNPANWDGWVRAFFFIVWIAWCVLQYQYYQEKKASEK